MEEGPPLAVGIEKGAIFGPRHGAATVELYFGCVGIPRLYCMHFLRLQGSTRAMSICFCYYFALLPQPISEALLPKESHLSNCCACLQDNGYIPRSHSHNLVRVNRSVN